MDLALYRRFYAEEIETAARLASPALVEALAQVPREAFLPPGPWTIRSDADPAAGPRVTPDADPRRIYHNVAVALDAPRMLFNGAPALVSMAIDRLAIEPGHRVLHVGTGTGYYTALIGRLVGPQGRVLGIEVDPDLAAAARANLANMPQIAVRQGNGTAPLDEVFDAILVNAGVTHPLDGWLDALAPGGRMMLPITATMPAMAGIGKGLLLLITRAGRASRWPVSPVMFLAIYSAIDIRDDAINHAIGVALARDPRPQLRSLRRDAHDTAETCWVHARTCCLSVDPPA